MNIAELIGEVTEAINKSSDYNELSGVVWKFCKRFEVENFIFGAALFSNMSTTPEIHLLSGYPEEWRDRYDEMGYMEKDITVQHCKSRNTPIVWPSIKEISGVNKKIFSESSDFNINSGISYPYHGTAEEFGMFSITTSEKFSKSGLTNAETQFVMQIIGAALFDYYKQKSLEESEVKLTSREKECLKWVAAGKTSWETSVILGVSERTVIFHIQNAASKMNTASRTNAAVRAKMNGII